MTFSRFLSSAAVTICCAIPAFAATLAPNGTYVYTSLDTGLGGGPSVQIVTDLTRSSSNQFASGSGAYGNAGLGDVHTLVKARSTTDGSFAQIAQATTESQFQDRVFYQDPTRAFGEAVSVTASILVTGTLYTPSADPFNLGVTTIRYTFEAFDADGILTETSVGDYTQRSNGFNEGTNFIGLLPLTFTLHNMSFTTIHFVLGAGAATSANLGHADDLVAYADLSHSAHWQGITLAGGGELPGTLTSDLSVDWFATNSTQPDAPEPGTWILLGTGLAGAGLVRRRKSS